MEFDSTPSTEQSEKYFMSIEAILGELDEKSNPVMKPEVPALFSQLINNLRQLDTRQLTHIYQANKVSRVWRFLVDAAPMVATSSSTALVADLITSGQMTADEADIWYTSLAFISSPDVEMFVHLPVSNGITLIS